MGNWVHTYTLPNMICYVGAMMCSGTLDDKWSTKQLLTGILPSNSPSPLVRPKRA